MLNYRSMKIFTVRKILLLVILSLLSSHFVSAATNFIPSSPKIKAEGYILVDFNSGQVMAEKNADKRMEPASLTKMMSSYVVAYEIENREIDLDDQVLVSKKAWRMKGSRMFIEVGKKIPLLHLLKGMIVQSGNDATIALAEHVAKSEKTFVVMMNNHARRLGMRDTHFQNATGLPGKNHYTTPRDMAKLGNALIRDFPNHYEYYSIKSFLHNKINQKNRNKLLWNNKFVDGIKTGHTKSAGYCLVGSALKDNMRITSVVLGTKSKKARIAESDKLISYGFRFFETHRLYAAFEPLTNVRIWKGDLEQLPIGLSQDLYITIPKGQYKNLAAQMNINAEIIAPAKKGQKFGELNIKLGSTEYARRELISLADVVPATFWRSLLDAIRMSLK